MSGPNAKFHPIIPEDELNEQRERCLQEFSTAHKTGDRRQMARCIHTLGNLSGEAADFDSALPLFESAFAMYAAIEDPTLLHQLGKDASLIVVLDEDGRPCVTGYHETAVRCLNEGISLAREQKDLRCLAAALFDLGVEMSLYMNDKMRARRCFDESRSLYRDLGDLEGYVKAREAVKQHGLTAV